MELCPILTDIKICGNEEEHAGNFIGMLENAPTLKFLDITDFFLTLSDLEALHEQTPLLVSLSLNDVFLVPDIDLVDVLPVDSMMKLSVHTKSNHLNNGYTNL